MQWLNLTAFCVAITFLIGPVSSGKAPHHDTLSPPGHLHTAEPRAVAGQWEGSPEGKAYSEFNHHLAGVFVLLIGISELRGAIGVNLLAWTRYLLPAAMLGAGGFLLIWSDHDAWPIGSLSFTQTFFSNDFETVQHKLYAILLLAVGAIEWLKRMRRTVHAAWGMPLPVFALIGGLMLFLHSHGAHPSAHQIAFHHSVMGTMAILAGLCKLAAEPFPVWSPKQVDATRAWSGWGLAWAGLVLLIGVELLIYTE